MFNKEQIETFIDIANKVPKSPWVYDTTGDSNWIYDAEGSTLVLINDQKSSLKKYICTFSPDTILGMLQRIQELECEKATRDAQIKKLEEEYSFASWQVENSRWR